MILDYEFPRKERWDRCWRGVVAIEFWFGFATPYFYVAAERVGELTEARTVDVRWACFLLGPIFDRQGWSDTPFMLFEGKGRSRWPDMERMCAGYELNFFRSIRFPRNGWLAALVGCLPESDERFHRFARRVIRTNFYQDREIDDVSPLASFLEEPDRPGEDVLERAVERGNVGAPSICIDDGQFWNRDRLDDANDWVSKSGSS